MIESPRRLPGGSLLFRIAISQAGARIHIDAVAVLSGRPESAPAVIEDGLHESETIMPAVGMSVLGNSFNHFRRH